MDGGPTIFVTNMRMAGIARRVTLSSTTASKRKTYTTQHFDDPYTYYQHPVVIDGGPTMTYSWLSQSTTALTET
jgi:hypothetical protein